MKLKFSVLFCAAVLFSGTSLFSTSPSSNIKTSSAGLHGDGAVDSIGSGISGIKGIFFTGFKSANNTFNVGNGLWLTDNLWWSLYYEGSNVFKQTNVKSDKETEFEESETSFTETINTNGPFTNKVYTNLYFKQVKLGGELYWNGINNNYSGIPLITADKGISSTTTTSSSSSEEYFTDYSSSSKVNSWENFRHQNTFGINFNGFKTPNLLPVTGNDASKHFRNVYVQLGTFSIYFDNVKKSSDYSGASKNTEELLLTQTNYITNGLSQTLNIRPYLSGSATITFPSLGKISPVFTLSEALTLNFYSETNKSVYSTTSETSEQKTTEDSTYDVTFGKRFSVTNKVTPKFDFNVSSDSNLSLKFRAQADIATTVSVNGADYVKTGTVTTVFDKNTETEKKYYGSSVQTFGEQQSVASTTVSITPAFWIGGVYKAKPDKFHLSFGAKISPSTFTWKTEKKANTGIKTYKISGENTTDPQIVEIKEQGDGVAETVTDTFTVATQTSYFYFGAKYFFNSVFSLDACISTGSNSFGISSILDNTAMNIMFIVKY